MTKIFQGPRHVEDVEDLVQDTMVRILKSLDSFRGDSAFTTWATGIAMRVGFTELRRRRVRAGEFESFDRVQAEAESLSDTKSASPDLSMARNQLQGALSRAIAEDLTHRQQVAILAELRGIPTIEIAAQLSITTNALYKLVHDARKKLKKSLQRAGFTAEMIREHVEEKNR